MAEFPAPFIGPTYSNSFLDASKQRCVNWYPKDGTLAPRPGMTSVATVGSGPIRGMIEALGKLYVVSGNNLYELDSNLTVSASLGTLTTSVNPISMDTDGTGIIILDGTSGYTYDGSTFATISDVDFTGTITSPKIVQFFGGFYFVHNEGEQRIYKSQTKYDNGATWNGEFASAEYNPDDLATIVASRADIWLLGEKSLESWYYSGADFPLDPNPNTFQDYGCMAPYSATKFNNGIAFLARSNEVERIAVATEGYKINRISNTVIEREWATYTTVSDCIGWSMKMPGQGHFLVFTFPTADKTWVYDAEEQQWHEWERYHEDPAMRGRHRANCYANFAGKHLVGDYSNGSIYQLSNTVYTDNGTVILGDRMGPDLYNEKDRIFYHQVEVDMNVGVGLNSSSASVVGSNPDIRLYYSDDRGQTWSNFKTASVGKIGEYDTRVIFRRLGSSRNRIFRITMSDPVPRRIINAVVDATPGTH